MSKVDLRHRVRPTHPAITRDSLGVWLDGAYGWHNTYRVVDAAVSYGFKLSDDDAAALDIFRSGEVGHPDEGELAFDLATEATDYLQSLVTDDDIAFVWDCGELALMEVDEDGEPVL